MVFGDSLSAAYGLDEEQGWAYLLQDRLSDSGDEREVINLSVSGETTGGGWARLPDALEVYRPSILVLELGANDGLRGLSVKRMQRNLTNMVSAAQDSGAQSSCWACDYRRVTENDMSRPSRRSFPGWLQSKT